MRTTFFNGRRHALAAVILMAGLYPVGGMTSATPAPRQVGRANAVSLPPPGEGAFGLRPAAPMSIARPPANHQLYVPMITRQATNAKPVIVSFTADPAHIQLGGQSTLRWTVTGATNLRIDPGVGPVTGQSVGVKPEQTTEYTLTASNAWGS